MESALIRRLLYRHDARSASRSEGISLLEMMLVITLILIVASISTPYYRTAVVLAREAALRDDLFTMRRLIERFTFDYRHSPARLEELVTKGSLGRLPTDPFTGLNETWQEVKEAAPLPPETSPGVFDVHSGSSELALDGTAYNSW